MTRTELDVRDALTAKADEAADRVELPRPAPRRKLQRGLPIAGAVAAAAAIAVAVPLITTRVGHHAATPTTGSTTPCYSAGHPTYRATSLTSTVSFTDGGGLQFSSRWACANAQGAEVTYTEGHAEGPVAHVNVYQPGAFDPRPAEHGSRVTVHGHRGYFGVIDNPEAATICADAQSSRSACPLQPATKSPAIVWEYATGAWAVVQQVERPWTSWGSTQPQLLQVANAVGTGAGQPLLLPFRVGYLPPGLSAIGASTPLSEIARGAESSAATVGLASGGRADTLPCQFTDCGDLAISAWPDVAWDLDPGYTTVKIAGHTARYYAHGRPTQNLGHLHGGPCLEVVIGTWRITLTVAPSAADRIPRDELFKIAASVTIASSADDESTWFDARTVLPR